MNQTFAIFLILVVAILGPSIAIAVIGSATMKALGRNPSAAPKIYLGVIVMLIFAEGISISTLLVVFQIFGHN